MARTEASAIDAYGTLFGLHSVLVALKDMTVDAEAVS
jgi:hypothetical protein